MSEANRVILITGVAGYWGRRLAERLLAKHNYHVIGIDAAPPEERPSGLDFVGADVRNPLLVDLLRAEKVDTICHLAFRARRQRSEQVFDHNVMGAMKVFGAGTEADVRQIVHRSSTAVYGATPQNPAFLTESHSLHGSRRYGYVRDMVEIEEFCDGFRQQAPGVTLTTLRFANIIGPTAPTPLNEMLGGRAMPMLLGFDPLMQMVHEDDVIAAIAHAIEAGEAADGIFNVGAEGLMPLTRLAALTGAIPAPLLHPVPYWGYDVLRNTPLNPARYLPLDADYLRYRWVADTQKMTETLGFHPHYTAEEAVREFAGHKRTAQYGDGEASLAFDEERLRDTLERRRRQRERMAQREEKSSNG